MLKFKKDRLMLLKVLRDLITENMDIVSINLLLEQEVAEYLTEMTDKRRVRRLKSIRRALDKLIGEIEGGAKWTLTL